MREGVVGMNDVWVVFKDGIFVVEKLFINVEDVVVLLNWVVWLIKVCEVTLRSLEVCVELNWFVLLVVLAVFLFDPKK